MRSVINKAYPQVRDEGRIRLFKSHRPDYRNGEQLRDFIYVKDAVAMTLYFLEHPETGGIFNIGTGRDVSINDVWDQVCRLAGKDARPEYDAPRPGDIYRSVGDIAKARAQLGFEPAVSFEEGLAITREWYQQEGFALYAESQW